MYWSFKDDKLLQVPQTHRLVVSERKLTGTAVNTDCMFAAAAHGEDRGPVALTTTHLGTLVILWLNSFPFCLQAVTDHHLLQMETSRMT